MTTARPGFWSPEELRAACGGRWLVPPAPDVAARPTLGLGTDGREDLSGRVFVALAGTRFDGHDHLAQAADRGAVGVIVHRDAAAIPGGPPPGLPVVRVDDTRRALRRLASAWRTRLRTVRTVAITGSAGKTTTKRLLAAVLAERMPVWSAPRSFNNDLGVPLSILGARPGDRALVLELGMNRPGEIAPLARLARPDVAVITGIGTAHLEALGSREAIAAEKASIFHGLEEDGLAVAPADEPLLDPFLRPLRAAGRCLGFGAADSGADLRLTGLGPGWIEVNARGRFPLALPGRHNACNALAAILVARRLGCTDEQVAAGLARAEGEPLRWEVRREGGAELVLDCWNANPEAVEATLEAFLAPPADGAGPPPGPAVVVLGEMLELGPRSAELHARVGRRLAALDRVQPVRRVVLVGPGAAAYVDGEGTLSGDDPRVLRVAEADEAGIDRVAGVIEPGDRVLVKGSRRLALERVADRWKRRSAAAGPRIEVDVRTPAAPRGGTDPTAVRG